MKSNRQRRTEIKGKRAEAAQKRAREAKQHMLETGRWLPVDPSKLNMGNSYDAAPDYYRDINFQCADCGVEETWAAKQQKWWYEEANGYFFSTAIRCRSCRQNERERKAAAQEQHQKGIAQKNDGAT